MKPFLFKFDDYKAYLQAFIHSLPNQGYGFKTRMAEQMGCKTAYVAQVLNGGADLSLEQAESLNPVLHHNESEAEFFLLLVQCARAGTPALRRRIQAQLETLRGRQHDLKNRFKAGHELGEKEVVEFFSRWYIPAVHIASTIPHYRSRKAIARGLRIEEELVDEALEFLQANGLIHMRNDKIDPGTTRIFIGRDSAIMKMHHVNWRAKAVESLNSTSSKDVHFTSVYSLSAKEASLIRERLVREIEVIREIVKNSPEEELHAFTLDFFRIDA